MKAKEISASDLVSIGKWRADLHVHSNAGISSERFRVFPLRDLVTESKTAMNPSEMGKEGFYYIGLENVEPISGNPQGIEIVAIDHIRSRSKTFEEGDVLYGRLRPNLRKAFYVEAPYTNGLCSTEFIVLKAKTELILPLFLREILVSASVTKLVTRMQAGAALPRVSSKDLLNISIPVPPLSFQKESVSKIDKARKQRCELLSKANILAGEGQKIISEIFI